MKILVMGLPGAGKTYFADFLSTRFSNEGKHAVRLNADAVRRQFNDWDFSLHGRVRQSHRMRELADITPDSIVVCDFVAPLPEMRHNFGADWIVWIDTIDQGRFEDTNKIFSPPDVFDFRITEQNAEKWSEFVANYILENKRRPVFDWKKETVQMLGRWQPWHKGHRALFERAIAKTGQVIIQIRDCQGWNNSNPFDAKQISAFIRRDLDPIYQGQYEIMVVPNVVNITYGRDVGYKIEQEIFDESVTAISATQIRKQMEI